MENMKKFQEFVDSVAIANLETQASKKIIYL